MMQANKHDLLRIAGLLGEELSERLTTKEALAVIEKEFVKLHVCIVRLCPDVPRGPGVVDCRARFDALRKLVGMEDKIL